MAYKKKWSASEIIRQQYKGHKNFMTPHKVKVGKINPNVAFELSTGSGLGHGSKLYGVTVVSMNKKTWKTTPQYNISKAFGSKNEAEAYINKLKRKMELKRRLRK